MQAVKYHYQFNYTVKPRTFELIVSSNVIVNITIEQCFEVKILLVPSMVNISICDAIYSKNYDICGLSLYLLEMKKMTNCLSL